MRAFIALYILLPLGLYAMWRQKQDNKKYPNTYDAHFERSEKLYKQMKKMEKRYGQNSDQRQAAYKEWQDEQTAYTNYLENNKDK
jgi:hypothetical protein